jgi:hypothetical protein
MAGTGFGFQDQVLEGVDYSAYQYPVGSKIGQAGGYSPLGARIY